MNKEQFIQELGVHPQSFTALQILKLNEDNYRTLTAIVDPEDDYLVSITEEGFSVNKGNVGSRGLWYNF